LITFERFVTAENPMQPDELLSAERALARLVAEAFAGDHPEEFGDRRRDGNIMGSRPEISAPSSCAAANQGIRTAGESHDRIS
jgi:hypothetical protein